MLKNYIQIALRNFLKRKGYTFINVFGLASGLAICLLILLFIGHEKSYDRFQGNRDKIFRMVVDRQYPGRKTAYAYIPQSYAAAVKNDCPEVTEAVRVFDFLNGASLQLTVGDKKFEERAVYQADSNFFKVFNGSFLSGDRIDPLLKANSVVLTESAAKRILGDIGTAPGKMMQPEGHGPPLMVTAVVQDWPENSHFNFDILISSAGNDNNNEPNYVNFACYTYLLLNKGENAQQVVSRFPQLIKKYAAADIEKQFAQTYEQFQSQGNGYHYYLQPLPDIHLNSNLEGELTANGSQKALKIFSLVALIILVLACINFINLSTARSVERAKEVGIRKTFGSARKTIIIQFLVEAVLVSVCGMLLAVGLILLLLPFFNDLTRINFQVKDLFSGKYLALLTGLSVVTGLSAGIYPAVMLSSFQPIQVLKGQFKTSNQGIYLRNALVIMQFSISMALIICTITMKSQMIYMTNQQLGFNKEQVLVIERTDLLGEKTTAFRNELQQVKTVLQVSGTTALPGQENYFGVSWAAPGSKQPMTGRGIIADDQYLATLGLTMKSGRFFSKEFPTDSLAIILNEKAVADLGLKDPVGTQLTSPDQAFNAADGSPLRYTIIGVIKDYHFQSMRQVINPLVFNNAAKFGGIMNNTAVRLTAGNPAEAIKAIEQTWKKFVPERPFQYTFLDNTVEKQYDAETTLLKLFTFFSTMAIFIASLGLLGLITYAIQQKMKEISVRKVLGANVKQIAGLLSKDFLRLVLMATFLSFPIAWLLMHQWLQNFAYRVNQQAWVYLSAGIIAMVVTVVTIGFQAVRAGRINPIKTLRTE